MTSGSKRSVVLLPIMTSLILAGCVWKSDYEALQAQKPEELQVNKSVQEMDTGPLFKRVYRHRGPPLSREDYVDAAVEFHQRFALRRSRATSRLVWIIHARRYRAVTY